MPSSHNIHTPRSVTCNLSPPFLPMASPPQAPTSSSQSTTKREKWNCPTCREAKTKCNGIYDWDAGEKCDRCTRRNLRCGPRELASESESRKQLQAEEGHQPQRLRPSEIRKRRRTGEDYTSQRPHPTAERQFVPEINVNIQSRPPPPAPVNCLIK
jgi:hypothetical protein